MPQNDRFITRGDHHRGLWPEFIAVLVFWAVMLVGIVRLGAPPTTTESPIGKNSFTIVSTPTTIRAVCFRAPGEEPRCHATVTPGEP